MESSWLTCAYYVVVINTLSWEYVLRSTYYVVTCMLRWDVPRPSGSDPLLLANPLYRYNVAAVQSGGARMPCCLCSRHQLDLSLCCADLELFVNHS
jgi:hypothetical protein